MDLFGEGFTSKELEKEHEKKLVSSSPHVFDAEAEDEFAHPRLTKVCLGHEAIEQEFLNLFNAGRLPHALLLSGVCGIGKATLAFRMARFLLKHGGGNTNQDSMFGEETPLNATTLAIEAQDPISRLVAANAHPDMLSIERIYDESKNRYKDSVDIASIRKVTPFLRMTSSEGSYRVVIIDDADTMNRNAQNALLKILEEPPAKTLIILIAHRAGALIPTIRSRARLVNLHPLKAEHFTILLSRYNQTLSNQDIQTITSFTNGRIGKAIEYIEQGAIETFDKLLAILNTPNDWERIHTLANELSKAGQDAQYTNFTVLMKWIYQTLLFAKARGTPPPTPLDGGVFSTILATSSLEELVKICDDLTSHFDTIKHANLDKKQGVLGAFFLVRG